MGQSQSGHRFPLPAAQDANALAANSNSITANNIPISATPERMDAMPLSGAMEAVPGSAKRITTNPAIKLTADSNDSPATGRLSLQKISPTNAPGCGE